MRQMNNRQKMVVKASEHVQKYLLTIREAQKQKKRAEKRLRKRREGER